MMDRMLVYAKTPAGEEATRQRTRVVQRNLRMVLLQVDGQLNVDGLVAKIGNESLVFGALRELEKGGYIALSSDAPSVWEQSKIKVKKIGAAASAQISQFSNFGPSRAEPLDNDSFEPSISSESSTFGKLKRPKKTVPAAVATPQSPAPIPPPTPVASASVPKLPPIKPLPPGNWVKPRSLVERLQEVLVGLTMRFKVKKKPVGGDLAPYRHKSWPLRIAGGVAALVVTLFLVMLLYPYNNYRPGIEASLGLIIGTPVRIGSVGVQVLPRPSLTLHDVRVGEGEELRIGTIIVPQLLSLSGSGRKVITEVEAKDVVIQADFLASLPRLLSGVRASQNLVLERTRAA